MSNQKSWIQHEPLLTRVYLSSSLFSSSSLSSEFKKFVSRYKEKAINSKAENNDITCKMQNYSNGVPLDVFTKKFTVSTSFASNLINPFQLREVPSAAIEEFEFIVAQYFKFRNSRRFKKLKKLKNCQTSLPIANVRNDIVNTLNESQVVIIAGNTGCGKSTQLPQYLLQTSQYGRIACTQPRRLACTALSNRVACEMFKQFSSEIAFQTRFDKTKTSATKLLFLTEGVLLRQMASDLDLAQYDVVILDEVHERNVSADLLVSLLRNLCHRRPCFKLILMSATINLDLFTSFFPNAPVIKVPGRLYPIELKYMPPKIQDLGKQSSSIDCTPYVNILQLIDSKYPSKERGDALIFLNGISEISTIADALKEYADFSKKWIILILHSTLSVEEQNKVFDLAPIGLRKCILSTNIAETSVTIDEVRFVIDSGKENQMRYEATTKSHRLTETWISKASADQRKGRAGRTGPGVCFRLYSEQDFEKMENFTLPEVKRISLESLIMQIFDMNLNIDIRDFEFIERPDIQCLNEALESLKSQGIVNSKNEKELTLMGTILSKLPVSVPVGKMLISSCVLDEVDIALTIAAGLSVQSPFTNRSFRDHECMQTRQHLISDLGDPFTLVKIYREWLKLRAEGKDTRKWTRHCGIEESRLYEIAKLRHQLRSILEQNELIPDTAGNSISKTLDSRKRRITLGEKRKLYDLKKRIGFEERKSKVLKEGRHFDTILDEKEEFDDDNGDKNKSGLQTDINSLEFSILIDQKKLQREIDSHKLSQRLATIVKMIITLGCYPQYAVVDTGNNFRIGHDLFAHTTSKPFVVVHPNSAIGQMPESLQFDTDAKHFSINHQLIFYGMLLETTKCFLCNSCRIPAFFLLLTARNITLLNTRSLECDGFVEFQFSEESELTKILKLACEIRTQFLFSVENKLENNNFLDARDLQKKIVKFSELQISFSVKKNFGAPKLMSCGIFTENGDEHPLFTLNSEASSSILIDEINDDDELDELDKKERHNKREYYCLKCNMKMWFENNVEIIRHKTKHKTDS